MVSGIFVKVFGTKNTRELKRLGKIVARVNACEAQMQALSDDELKAKTTEFRQRLAAGETVDDLLPEAFAVRTTCRSWAASRCMKDASPRCGPAKAKRSSQRCLRT